MTSGAEVTGSPPPPAMSGAVAQAALERVKMNTNMMKARRKGKVETFIVWEVASRSVKYFECASRADSAHNSTPKSKLKSQE